MSSLLSLPPKPRGSTGAAFVWRYGEGSSWGGWLKAFCRRCGHVVDKPCVSPPRLPVTQMPQQTMQSRLFSTCVLPGHPSRHHHRAVYIGTNGHVGPPPPPPTHTHTHVCVSLLDTGATKHSTIRRDTRVARSCLVPTDNIVILPPWRMLIVLMLIVASLTPYMMLRQHQ